MRGNDLRKISLLEIHAFSESVIRDILWLSMLCSSRMDIFQACLAYFIGQQVQPFLYFFQVGFKYVNRFIGKEVLRLGSTVVTISLALQMVISRSISVSVRTPLL